MISSKLVRRRTHKKLNRRLTRTMIVEGLTPRQLLAADTLSSIVDDSALEPSIRSAAFQAPRSMQDHAVSINLSDTEAAKAGKLPEQATGTIDKAVSLSQETYSPDLHIETFRQQVPSLAEIEPMLIGRHPGARISQLESGDLESFELTSIGSEELDRIAKGDFAAVVLAPEVANQLSGSLQSELRVGSYCRADGSLHTTDLVAFSSSSGEGEGSTQEGGENGNSSIVPQIEVPTLVAGQQGPADSFTPDVSSTSSSVSVHGSFTAASIDNPDFDAEGLNWVHTIDRVWISDTQWSFTERLIVVFNLSNTTSDSGDAGELSDESGSEGSEEPGGGTSGLDESGTWTSSLTISRNGFFMFTFTASRGITTPASAGIKWSADIDFNDRVTVSAGISGGSTFIPDPNVTASGGSGSSGEGEGYDDGYGDDYPDGSDGSDDYPGGDGPTDGGDPGDTPSFPDDFVAHSAWSAGILLTIHSIGDLHVSSTPSISSDGVVERDIDASGSYDYGGDVHVTADWSASSQSGNLTPLTGPGGCITCSSGAPSNPLPDGGDTGFGHDDVGDAIDSWAPDTGAPFDPLGDYEGHGHASASSGGEAAALGGKMTGSWNLQGIIRNGHWSGVIGGALAAMEADVGGNGKSKHLFVYQPEPTITPLHHGTLTEAVTLRNGWDDKGTEKEFLHAQVDSSFLASPDGEIKIDDSGDAADITGDADAGGFNFMNLKYNGKGRRQWNIVDEPTDDGHIHYFIGYDNGDTTIEYSSANYGKGIGDYVSKATPTAIQNAEATSDLNGHGKELVKIVITSDTDSERDEEYFSVGERWVGEEAGNSSHYEKYVNKFEAEGELTATLQPDDSVIWSGTATETTKSKAKYDSHNEWGGKEIVLPEELGLDWQYDEIRDAHFERTASLTSVFDAATGEFTNTFTVGGDDEVTVTGHDIYGDAWTDDDKTALEVALESIFIDGNSSYPDPPPNPGPGLPPNYVYPSNPGSHGWISWFGGNAGDSFDVGLNAVAGFADAATPTSWATRKLVGFGTGFDGADEDSTEYFYGEVGGTIVSFAIPGSGATSAANKFDEAGKCANWLTKLWHGGCFVAGTRVTLSGMPRNEIIESELWSSERDDILRDKVCDDRPEHIPSRALQVTQRLLQIPIEEVPLGARVPTKNPKPWEFDNTLPEPEPSTWVKLCIKIEREDAGTIEGELLRPRDWVEANGIQVGRPISFRIEELQVNGIATVWSIRECPAITDGCGSAVTGRFTTKRVDEVVSLEVASVDGTIERIEGTRIHPVWSMDRNDWVPLGDLRNGEKLFGDSGPAEVISVCALIRATPVYNIEVHGEHVYAVGTFGLLVHNSDFCFRALREADRIAFEAGERLMPKASGGTILDHIQGFATKYISVSKTKDGALLYDGGNGVVKISLEKLRQTGSTIVPHEQLLQVARRHGRPIDVKNVQESAEFLIKGGIDPSAIIQVL